MTCETCRKQFVPRERRHRFCSVRCQPGYQRRLKKLRERTRQKKTERTCPTCGRSFRITFTARRGGWAKVYCSTSCRKSWLAQHSQNGRYGTFFIDGMTPAEFAFKTIMASEGKTLRFIDPHVRMFRLGKTSYTPDFEDKEGAYYEVIGTRQAFHANKRKYAAFRAAYPDVKLHIVAPNGHVLGLPRGLQTTERRLFGDADGL